MRRRELIAGFGAAYGGYGGNVLLTAADEVIIIGGPAWEEHVP